MFPSKSTRVLSVGTPLEKRASFHHNPLSFSRFLLCLWFGAFETAWAAFWPAYWPIGRLAGLRKEEERAGMTTGRVSWKQPLFFARFRPLPFSEPCLDLVFFLFSIQNFE